MGEEQEYVYLEDMDIFEALQAKADGEISKQQYGQYLRRARFRDLRK